MDSLEDSEQQTSKIVSYSLILTPPATTFMTIQVLIQELAMNGYIGLCDGNEQIKLMFTNCLRSYLRQRRKQRASTSRAFEESTKPFQIDEQSTFGIIVLQDKPHYKAPFSIFNKQDLVFRNLILTMDSLSSDLHGKGLELNGEVLKSQHMKTRIYFGLKDHLAVDHHKCPISPFSFTQHFNFISEVYKNNMS